MHRSLPHSDKAPDGANPARVGCPSNAGSLGIGQVFLRIAHDPDVGRTATYYRDDFSGHRTVAETDAAGFRNLNHKFLRVVEGSAGRADPPSPVRANVSDLHHEDSSK